MSKPDPRLSSTAAGRWVRSSRVLHRSGGFGVVALARDRDRPMTLQGTGVALWELLAVPHTTTELISEMADRFGVEDTVVGADLEQALGRLVAAGLVEVAS